MSRPRAVASLLLLAVALSCSDGPTGLAADLPTDPELAEFETSDLVHFWEAMDAGGTQGKLDTLYLRRASPGLREFMSKRGLTPQTMRTAIQAWPTWYASIRTTSLSLTTDTTILRTIRDNYAEMKVLYPDAVFAPVTFLMGRFSTGGTIGRNGILIGAEFYTKAPGSPLDDITPFQRNNVRPVDSLPIIVAHEHVHVLQARVNGGLVSKSSPNLLEQSLAEGSADFIGELVSGGNINAGLQAWALPREDSLWTAFQAQMHARATGDWLYNQGTATPARPGDLGYFMGYRIAKAYYDAAVDKAAAVRAIIRITDADAFLAASGYAP